MPTRDEAWELVCEWTESDSLRKHMLAVETAVRAYARRFAEDEEKWAVAGLVHDLDYERHPDPADGHPRHAVEELRLRGYPEDVIHAVLSHAEYMGVPRDALLDRALFACDELSGFVTACAYVRPAGIDGLTAKSVKKKLKQPSFAAGVNRDDVRIGAEELEGDSGLSFDEHVQFVIDALAERANELGLGPREG
jgi:putative nucleotidyltransferase with HDIG domain